MVVIPVDVVNPVIGVPSEEYKTTSPSLNPWSIKLITSFDVDIPLGLTISFLLVYPLPPSITSIEDMVFVLSLVLNLWTPAV